MRPVGSETGYFLSGIRWLSLSSKVSATYWLGLKAILWFSSTTIFPVSLSGTSCPLFNVFSVLDAACHLGTYVETTYKSIIKIDALREFLASSIFLQIYWLHFSFTAEQNSTVFICMCVRVYIHIYIYTRTHIDIHTPFSYLFICWWTSKCASFLFCSKIYLFIYF